MNAKPSQPDAALAKVAPDRRKFLGMLLAGTAALPLIRSASLNAEGLQFQQKPIKATSATPLKNSGGQLKNATPAASSPYPSEYSPLKNSSGSSQLKNSSSPFKNSSTTGSSPYPAEYNTFKNPSSTAPLKDSTAQTFQKNPTGSAPLKNTTGPVGQKNVTSAAQLKNQMSAAPLKNSTGQLKNSSGTGAPPATPKAQ